MAIFESDLKCPTMDVTPLTHVIINLAPLVLNRNVTHHKGTEVQPEKVKNGRT